MFPQKLTDARAFEIANTLLGGFNKHYRLFRATTAEAKQRFERADWQGQQRAQAQRIEFYDQRVDEAVALLEERFQIGSLALDVWQQVKLHYIGLLTDHHQPELAETFFNSVCTRVLHHSYFRNDFIFVRPAISTEYLENNEPAAKPTFRCYYPTRDTMRETLVRIVNNFQLDLDFEDLGRDVDGVLSAVHQELGLFRWRANFQIQVLSSLFYRNKGAYVVGKIVNGFSETPFALPILHNEGGLLYIDAALFGEDDLLTLFSFAHAYFMVDMEVPSACVAFLRSMMPRKPRAELYNAIGLQKHGKSLFYRDFLQHLRHSSDKFRTAPGIKGLVMLVFDLPSYPFVFKLIKDNFPPQKEHTTRASVQGKYLLVKQHDRVGRMADTLEFSNVAFPRWRFDEALIKELKLNCASLVEEQGDDLILKHVYIERRMVPLNIYLQEATPAQLEQAVIEYGHAIKDLVAANIFPGDMLWKNFGVTRRGKIVFYDYDEIEYLTDCNFRTVPAPRNEEEEMSGEVWYRVGPRDVFPETFGPFLLGHPGVREVFMKHHAELLDAAYWQGHKARIQAGHVHDVFPYEAHKRFPRFISNAFKESHHV
ncbi:bifunctional isocitrate dehydrogenase kinase/phosphatase [Pelomonas sp. V22]|uniref:bifunctional isocitrate dehydrogenase kinase/phosphatase n=1 Tax=Pelomonas sp. V22 TaxID=2822139 RepID=UPI0024A865EB|nr:bifunctional isocitrate dehydrogenase kinase/phosphatase [Pelomonas sp. V22]MDI4635064.1 bifunctional isocitrate dehydrogenase kinase/phosphatase [Pelomonas sp. V22]